MMPARTLWRVDKGALRPADNATVAHLRERGYNMGDVLSAELRKPRNPRFHGLAHALGGVLAENLDEFGGMEPHAVLKRLQIEGGIACDELMVVLQGVPVPYRVPRSLSFASMDEGEFKATVRQFCEYVSRRYWPQCSPDEIERMAEVWVDE